MTTTLENLDNNANLTRRGFFMFFLQNDSALEGDWGLPHLTLLGQIEDTANLGFEALWEQVASIQLTTREVAVALGEKDSFGLKGEYEVLKLVDKHQQLQALHERLLEAVTASGFKLMLPQFNGENYNPHVSLHTDSTRGATEDQLRELYGEHGFTVDTVVLKESVFDENGNFVESKMIGSKSL